MPNAMSNPAPNPQPTRRLRAAASGMQGGASSMLRLAKATEARLPSNAALSGWAERAASMLDLSPLPEPMPVERPLPAPPLPHGRRRQSHLGYVPRHS